MLTRMGMGAELLLLAIDDRRGGICNSHKVASALAAAELVELALDGRIGLSGAHLMVREMGGVTDPELNSALLKVSTQQRPLTVEAWLAVRGDLGRVRRYVLELERAGAVHVDDASKPAAGKDAMVVHIQNGDLSRAAVDRFREVAHGSRASIADEAFAALADAVGLTHVYLGGLSNRRARARLSALTAHRSDPPPEPGRTALAIVRAAVRTIAETAARRDSGSEQGGSMAIPLDKQFVMQPGIQAALHNPNIP